MSGQKVNSSKIRHKTATTQKDQPAENQEDEQNNNNQVSVRNILGFIERYDRTEILELLSQMNCHWLLSLEDFKIPIEHPTGLISQMRPLNEESLYILIPYDEEIELLDYREMHQIIRELTVGIYVLNQHPSLQLETNFDESTSCQMPPAYIDTKVGQIMINTDYWLKALWHGAYIPREKRIKFSERWRQLLDVDAHGTAQTKKSILNEFMNAGLTDIAYDHDYSYLYPRGGEDDDDQVEVGVSHHKNTNSKSNNSLAMGIGMGSNMEAGSAFSDLAERLNMTEEQIIVELDYFNNYINDIALQMTFGMKEINQYKNLYEIDGEYDINIVCKADNDQIDNAKFERIKPILDWHEDFLRANFANKKEIKRNLNRLKIISFLVPLLIGLKKRMKIPNMNTLLPLMTGEDVHTERELPPLMLGPDFRSKRFANLKNESTNKKYFNLHGGIQFELETCHLNQNQNFDGKFEEDYENITQVVSKTLQSYLESEQQLQEYKVPVILVGEKKYWCVRIDFESYYAQSPQKPFWVNKLTDDLTKLKPKRLPMNEQQMYDLFKKHFGFKKATKYKNATFGLRASAQRGFLNIFQSIIRKTPINQLSKHDEFGLSLMHYAAIFNRPLIISNLVMISLDPNIKQQIDYATIGPMPLHYAARCGSLDAASCLLANYGNISFADNKGWAPIHHACYFDNVPIIKLLIRKQQELLELATRSESRQTPILVAASAGSLEAVKCLIKLGANITYHDEYNYNLIHLATHHNHKNIIEYFIDNKCAQLNPWSLLINMLTSDRDFDKESAVKCLELLTHSNKKFWKDILNANGIEKLCAILKSFTTLTSTENKETRPRESSAIKHQIEKAIFKSNLKPVDKNMILLNSLSVLCNLSDQVEIKTSLSEVPQITTILIQLMRTSNNEDVQSRCAILIADIASISESNRADLANQGCLDNLLSLLDSDVEDLLVNCVNAIEILCKNSQKNQDYCCERNVLASFITLLQLNSDLLKASVSAAISAITHNNTNNQTLCLKQGVIEPVVNLLKSRNITVQLKAALAIESLTLNNQATQKAVLDLDAASYLIKLMEDHTSLQAAFEYRKNSNQQTITLNIEYKNELHNKVITLPIKEFISTEIKANMDDWSIVVREQAAYTLWTLAGNQKAQRKDIAEKIGTPQIISMLMSKSERLQYVGCKCVISLVLENQSYQNQMLNENGIDPLLRLIKIEKLDKTNHRVILAAIETIGALCIDIAHVNNERLQNELVEKGAIDILLYILDNPPSKFIQIETAHALACLILNNKRNDELSNNIDIEMILNLIHTDDEEMKLKAGLAITVLAYNNNSRQFDIKAAGGLSFEVYRKYFEDRSVEAVLLCQACFQVVVLARVINDREQVWLTAMAISRLVSLLLVNDTQVVIQSASYLSSLAHTRAGITDAMITCDIVDILCDHLYSPSSEVQYVSAVALGYLTFNRTASRFLLHNCRNVPHLYDKLISIIKPETKISKQFIESFQTAYQLGLPKLLAKNSVKLYSVDYANRTELNQKNLVKLEKFFNSNKKKEEEKTIDSTNSFYNRSQSAPMSKLRKSEVTFKLPASSQNKPNLGTRHLTQINLKLNKSQKY